MKLKAYNLRSLKLRDFTEIKPITVLLGNNSSGKSSFARIFPLLKQSIQGRAKGPILWFGDYVDFGSFSEAISSNCNDTDYINLSFQFDYQKSRINSGTYVDFIGRKIYRNRKSINFQIDLYIKEVGGFTYLHKIQIGYEGNKVDVEFDSNLTTHILLINGSEYKTPNLTFKQNPNGLIPTVEASSSNWNQELIKKIIERIKLLIPYGSSINNKVFESLINSMYYRSRSEVFSLIKQQAFKQKSLKNYFSTMKENDKVFTLLIDGMILLVLDEVWDLVNHCLSQIFLNSKYIAPLRANPERYHRFQDLYINEVDHFGRNIPMMLISLTDEELEDFNAWCSNSIGYIFDVDLENHHVSIKVAEKFTNNFFNLTDTGFGLAQILPILFQIWKVLQAENLALPIVICIEQPELHLHPRMQGRIADIIVTASEIAKQRNVDLYIVLETHSEHIINRLGNLIRKKQISENDISILIFDKDSYTNLTNVNSHSFNDRGLLLDWPYGFFNTEVD